MNEMRFVVSFGIKWFTSFPKINSKTSKSWLNFPEIISSKKRCRELEKNRNGQKQTFRLVAVYKLSCRPQIAFVPIIKVSPQFLIKGISSNKPMMQIIYIL